MNQKIPESELIINPDGSIYHIHIRPENLADTVLIVGDPKRVDLITAHFDHIEFRNENREIHTQTGTCKGKRITVMSTGMGPDNIDIVINELDALVNIDFKTRKEKETKTSLNIIRLGTSGAIQPDLPMNATIMSSYGLGLDGLLHFYRLDKGIIDQELTDLFIQSTHWPAVLPKPYVAAASSSLVGLFANEKFYKGITATAPGFYGPQGRVLRIPLAYTHLNQEIRDFKAGDLRILNFEMETSALYGLGKLLGHNTLSLCIAIASRVKHQYNKDYPVAMDQLIERVLNVVTKIR
ncbi:MAG: nucleoside phosphorylase [Bacteroidales bacterium]